MYWREYELQLLLVHSHSLHQMQHYLTPSVIYVMNWESEVLLVLDNLLCAQVAILLLLLHVGNIRLCYMLETPVPPSNSLVALPVSVIKKSWRCRSSIFKCLNAATLLGSGFDLVLL
jgi:hypothetical protein